MIGLVDKNLGDNMKKEDVLRFIFRIINSLIPKNKKLIIFESIPDFSDNVFSIFSYIQNNQKFRDEYFLVWLINDEKFLKKLKQKDIVAYQKFSLKGLYHLLRSRYIFVTHNSFITLKTRNQILINLWHGMPLKRMLFANPSVSSQSLSKLKKTIGNVDIFIATSAIMENIIASCFYADPRKIHLTGQPRNDRLFNVKSQKNLSRLLNIDLSNYEKIVIFCPTFRQSKYNIDGMPKNNVDGILQKNNIFNFDDYDKSIFLEYLKTNKILFLLKLHPFEEQYYVSKFKNQEHASNIFLITKKMLQEQLIDFYDILNAVDILITDYSSIYFDFLLTNKPIIFSTTDLEEYSKTRGFILEPYDFWTPGPKVNNFKNFLNELTNIINNPNYYKKEREMINCIVNKYQDANSCERVCDLVFGNK